MNFLFSYDLNLKQRRWWFESLFIELLVFCQLFFFVVYIFDPSLSIFSIHLSSNSHFFLFRNFVASPLALSFKSSSTISNHSKPKSVLACAGPGIHFFVRSFFRSKTLTRNYEMSSTEANNQPRLNAILASKEEKTYSTPSRRSVTSKKICTFVSLKKFDSWKDFRRCFVPLNRRATWALWEEDTQGLNVMAGTLFQKQAKQRHKSELPPKIFLNLTQIAQIMYDTNQVKWGKSSVERICKKLIIPSYLASTTFKKMMMLVQCWAEGVKTTNAHSTSFPFSATRNFFNRLFLLFFSPFSSSLLHVLLKLTFKSRLFAIYWS